MKPITCVKLILLVLLLSACTGYKSQFVSFKPPEAYPNKQSQAGLTIAGEAYADKKIAGNAFGFDIRGAGLLPVQLVMNNQGNQILTIVTGQTFLVDNTGNYWPLVPNQTAVTRLEDSTQLAAFFGKGTGRGAMLGGGAGAILGAALGIVSGQNIGEYIGKGAALGAAGGAVAGGASKGTAPDRKSQISNDIRTKGLEGKDIPPDNLANGFLFFPGEATSAKELRLQIQERETGVIRTIVLAL